MANWVTNYLTVKREIAEKYILNKENEVDFEILVPMPEELKDTIAPCPSDEELEKKYGASNWYDWSIKNWGCKWNASFVDIEEVGDDDEVRLTFETPWTTPDKWLNKFIEMGIGFHLAWYEEQGYRGIMMNDENCDDRFNFVTEFDLPDIEWIEDENGDYYGSDEKEPFDWRELTYEGEYEELMTTA